MIADTHTIEEGCDGSESDTEEDEEKGPIDTLHEEPPFQVVASPYWGHAAMRTLLEDRLALDSKTVVPDIPQTAWILAASVRGTGPCGVCVFLTAAATRCHD